MIKSKYNFFYNINSSEILAYNGRTNALALLEEEKYQKFTSLKDGDITPETLENYAQWEKGGFIVRSHEWELKVMRYGTMNNRFNTNQLNLTIAPTTNCNLACVYCYEKDSMNTQVMSEDVREKLVEMVNEYSSTIKKLTITWYGGEPLMALSVVEELSREFIRICDEKGIEYSASIVTNGYLLTREKTELLKELKITHMQVTIDGKKEIHDQRRPHIGGKGSFDRIIQNVQDVKGILPINIRINIDKENSLYNDELLQELKEYGFQKDVYLYLGYVEPSNGCYDTNTCLSAREFSEEFFRFGDRLRQEGFMYDPMNHYPHLKLNYCGADAIYHYVVAASGRMYKCWSDIGIKELEAGNLLSENRDSRFNFTTNEYLDYMLYDATEDKQCQSCSYLPICMGGCPKRRIENRPVRCDQHRYTLERFLKRCADSILAQRSREPVAQS